VSALPRTGGELALVGGLAGGMVLAGGALVLLTRRRTTG
jgi:LPXTG-motif cell wall-anchored protein